MKKLFTLLTLALLTTSVSAQITTKTWDFTAITDDEIAALTTDVDESHKKTFSVNGKDEKAYLQNVEAGTANKGDVTYVVKDANGNEISTTEGLIWGRSGDVIKASAFRIYTGTRNGIYFNYSKGIVRLPSIKAGQEVVVTTDSYTNTVTVTNTDDEPIVVDNEFCFIVKADGTVDIQFADKPYIKKIVVQNAAPRYTVTYALGEGTGTLPTQAGVKEGKTFTVADAPTDIAAPTGKEFKCWNDGTTDYNAGDTYTMGTNNVTLTAVYQTITTKYTITYNLGEGTGTAPTQTDLAESAEFAVAAAPGDLVAPTGKEFKCWNDGTTDYNAGATYTMPAGNVTLTAVYQDRTYKGLTPATTLDLSDVACTTFTTTWYTSNNMIKNSYYNAADGVVSFSPYGIYQSTSTQTWADKSSGNSGDNSWDATGVFKGSSYYFSKDSKCAQLRESRIHYYRITNCSGVSALVGGKAILEVYEVSAGVVTPDPVNESSVDAAGTITISGLNTSKEYIIAIRGNNGDSNVPFQEIAFNFPAVATTSVSVSSYEWATFCSDYALDFTGSDVKAYIVTGEEGTAITKEAVTTVAAGTPLLLNASEGDHNITIAAEGDDYSTTNKLQRGAGTLTKADSGSNWVLAVDGGKAMFLFIDADNATVPTNKAYLHLDSDIPTGEARSLFLDDDVTGIKNIKVGSEDNIYYDLQGRRVLYPTKGLYIVNGKKVILK